jgi:hypothetical protein
MYSNVKHRGNSAKRRKIEGVSLHDINYVQLLKAREVLAGGACALVEQTWPEAWLARFSKAEAVVARRPLPGSQAIHSTICRQLY